MTVGRRGGRVGGLCGGETGGKGGRVGRRVRDRREIVGMGGCKGRGEMK